MNSYKSKELSMQIEKNQTLGKNQKWPWWPLLPLYPYGIKKTFFKELIPGEIWSFEQLQGLYYVAVPVRLIVVKVTGGLMLFNPLPPTKELLKELSKLVSIYGPIKSIVLPTASGLEHKISMPAISRAFADAEIWLCPGQWSFPLSLPLSWIGIPKKRTRFLLEDGVPHKDCCDWISLGPLNIGLGRFQEVACYHKNSSSLLITDALVGISSHPPELFDFDPTPILFHSREKGNEQLIDTPELRKKGWSRLVLFASFLRPDVLSIPSIKTILSNSFAKGLRNPRCHFGLFPFAWDEGWEHSKSDLLGEKKPLLQVAPVLERLVFPRAKDSFISWLDKLSSIKGIKWLVPSHYDAPLTFNSREIKSLKKKIMKRSWASQKGNWKFLASIDKYLLEKGVVPNDPLSVFKD